MRELVTALTRAMITARSEGRADDVTRINRALSELLTVDVEGDDEPSAPGPAGPDGTRIGLGVYA